MKRQWQIDFLDGITGKRSVERWLDSLDKVAFDAVSKELKLLARVGNELKMPHSRPLGAGLFELRERKLGYRLYYCFHGKQIILLLAAGDKQSQENDIKYARKLLAQL
jgi:putative addiction module killer protein